MTTIAIRKYKDRIELATDSQGTQGGIIVKRQKIFSFDELGIIFTHCGYSDKAYIFKQYLLSKCVNDSAIGSPYRIFEDFRKWVKKNNLSLSSTDDKEDLEGYILILKKEIYIVSINSDCIEILDIDNFDAIGSGKAFALAAIDLGKSPKEAIALAIKYDLYSSGEIQEKIIRF